MKKMKSNREQLKNKYFEKKINLKVIRTNSHKLKSLTRLSYTSWEAIENYWYQVYDVQKQKDRQISDIGKNKTKIPKILRDNCVSAHKA